MQQMRSDVSVKLPAEFQMSLNALTGAIEHLGTQPQAAHELTIPDEVRGEIGAMVSQLVDAVRSLKAESLQSDNGENIQLELVRQLGSLIETLKSQPQEKGESATLPKELAARLDEIAGAIHDMQVEPPPPQNVRKGEKKRNERKARDPAIQQNSDPDIIPHPFTDLRQVAVRAAADAEEPTGSAAQGQTPTPQEQPTPPPDEQNGGNPDPAPGFPLRWPSGDREWAASTLAGKTGFSLNMKVK